jgi:ubiquinone/menaquinone biosynthesis C-methylase UbiE
MSDVAGAVLASLRRRAGRARIKVGVFYRGDPALLRALLAEGHATVVAGDRFRQLFRVAEQLGPVGARPFSIVEARFEALPFGPGSLDALVLTRGLPSGADPAQAIAALKPFLRPGGVIVFPHPVTDGRAGALSRVLRVLWRGTQPPCARHALCASAMSAGLKEISQIVPAGRGGAPWVVTMGAVGRC